MTTSSTVQKQQRGLQKLILRNLPLALIAFTISVFHFLSVASPFVAITSEYVLIWDTIPQMEFRLEKTQILQFISQTKVVRERRGILI